MRAHVSLITNERHYCEQLYMLVLQHTSFLGEFDSHSLITTPVKPATGLHPLYCEGFGPEFTAPCSKLMLSTGCRAAP